MKDVIDHPARAALSQGSLGYEPKGQALVFTITSRAPKIGLARPMALPSVSSFRGYWGVDRSFGKVNCGIELPWIGDLNPLLLSDHNDRRSMV